MRQVRGVHVLSCGLDIIGRCTTLTIKPRQLSDPMTRGPCEITDVDGV